MSVSTAAFYDEQFRDDAGRLRAWLQLGAIEKVRSLALVLDGHAVDDVLEIGCGSGAFLERAHAEGIGRRYWAADVSAEAIRHVEGLGLPLVGTTVGDGATVSETLRRRFDLVVLSHVLEHVDDPAALLRAALRCGRRVFIEVPLESTVGLNLKWELARRRGRVRTDNAAGHIQFFSKRSIEALVRDCGAQIIASRRYVPLGDEVLRANAVPWYKRVAMQGAHRVLGTERFGDLWYSHHALLVSPPSEERA